MKEPDMSVRLSVFCFFCLPGMTLILGSVSAQAKDSSATPLEGIHIHRSGSSPYFAKTAKQTLKAYQDQCALMKSVCAMMPVGASSKDKAACTQVAGGFSLKGNVADIGEQETDEYFATAMQMAARQIRKNILQVKSVCEVEVVAQESQDIWHYASRGYTHYELKNSPGKGRYWIRTEHKRLAPKAGALLAGVYPMSDASKVSPVLGHKTYAGLRCEVREITGPWAGTFCLAVTNTAFPGHLTLAGTVVAGKDTLLEDAATKVAVKITLPRDRFYPPEGEAVKKMSALSASSDNPTQKWCAKQKIQTGIDPCEDGSDDDKN